MEFGKRLDTTDTTDFARANFTCYGETGVMDFDLYRATDMATVAQFFRNRSPQPVESTVVPCTHCIINTIHCKLRPITVGLLVFTLSMFMKLKPNG